MREENCIFCKIAAGEIPSATLYEDEDFRVILDIEPASKGHALILPKEHFANLYELEDEIAELEGTRTCAECGAKVERHASFCSKCGAPMAEPVSAEDDEPAAEEETAAKKAQSADESIFVEDGEVKEQ